MGTSTVSNNILIVEIISICLGLSLIIGCSVFLCRRRCKKKNLLSNRKHGYDELDQEEIEFKRMIESHGNKANFAGDGEFDDDLFFKDTSIDEFKFDSKDKDRLNMLESFRKNLVAGSNDLNNNVGLSDLEAELNGVENMRL